MPKKPAIYIKQISIKVDEDTHANFLDDFKRSGLKYKGEFFRQILTDKKGKVVIKAVDRQLENRKLFLLSNLTNNVNQIAKHCNTEQAIDVRVLEALEELLEYTKEDLAK